jgi:hypothetical protein
VHAMRDNLVVVLASRSAPAGSRALERPQPQAR